MPVMIALVVLSMPLVSAAAGLVPCNGPDCQACSIVGLIQGLINFTIGLSIPIAMVLFAYAGVLYFTSATNAENVSKAKRIFKSVFFGFVITLGAYLIVTTGMHAILSTDYWSGWNSVQCVPDSARPTDKSISDLIHEALPAIIPVNGLNGVNTGSNGDLSCSGICVGTDLPSQSSTCLKDANNKCVITRETNAALVGMNSELNGGLLVTAAIGGNHYAACQNPGNSQSGTCVDAVYQGQDMTDPQVVRQVVQAANNNGLRAVLEVTDVGTYTDLQRDFPDLTNNGSVIYVSPTHATGNHFSIYLRSANPAP